MIVVILAAGRGARLYPLTKDLPKPLVEINGTPILGHMLGHLTRDLKQSECRTIWLGLGYEAQQIQQYAEAYIAKVNQRENNATPWTLNTCVVDDFVNHNNSYTLQAVLDQIETDEDLVLIEGDIVLHEGHSVFSALRKYDDTRYDVLAIAAPYQYYMSGSSVQRSEKDYRFNMAPRFEEGALKTVNIYRLKNSYWRYKLLPALHAADNYERYYEEFFKETTSTLKINLISPEQYTEIDNYEDYCRAQHRLAEGAEPRRTKVAERFGGLWRYGEVKDFYFISNPFYPTSDILERMKSHFEALVKGYPSKKSHINSLMKAYHNLHTDAPLEVSNGACASIQFILNTLSPSMERIVVLTPTFNEYLDIPPSEKLICHDTTEYPNFTVPVDTLVGLLRPNKPDLLVVVTPNNPTTAYYTPEDLAQVAQQRPDATLIVDTSLDMHREREWLTLADTHTNVVVIRSLGKLYGVAGLRLGYYYTHDPRIRQIRQPIWDVNSLAENFLEIHLNNQKPYERSLKLLENQVTILAGAFGNSCKVYASCANFFLVESKDINLAKRLFETAGIFVADMTHKFKKKDRFYARIGVRTPDENIELIEAYKRLISDAAVDKSLDPNGVQAL